MKIFQRKKRKSANLSIFLFNKASVLLLTFSVVLITITHFLSFDNLSLENRDILQSNKECWLKDAFNSGDFVVYSHRSFVFSSSDQDTIQPSCKAALSMLKDKGVNHLDLDLVLDEGKDNKSAKVVVSHPMEFKRESTYYSPCSLLALNDLIQILDEVYGKSKWFISLEPKASWGRTQEEMKDIALVEPKKIMSKLLEILVKFNLREDQCAVIIDVNSIHNNQEKETFKKLLDHCQLFLGKRRTDLVENTMEIGGFHYNKIMPTIEFHPNHNGHEGLTVPQQINQQSIYWVVDNAKDLRLAADLHPHGIVSNNPIEIVRIINDPNWCSM